MWYIEVSPLVVFNVLIEILMNISTIFELKSLLYHNNVVSGSDITPCIKIDKPLVIYIFSSVDS